MGVTGWACLAVGACADLNRYDVWRSADGLQWRRAGVLERAPSNPVLVSAGDQLFYSPSGGEGPPERRPAEGGWTSADGDTWTKVDLGPDGVLAGAFADEAGLLLVGSATVTDDRADAAFWRP